MLEELLQRLLGTAAPQNRLAAAADVGSAGYSYGPGGQYTGGAPIAPQAAPPMAAPLSQAPMPQPMGQPAPQARSGGILGGLFGGGRKSDGRNETIGWLTQQGLDEGTATLLAGNKSALQSYLLQRSKGQEPQKPIEINGRLVDPNTYEVLADFSTPKEEKKPWANLTPDEAAALGLPPGTYQRSPEGKIEATVTPRTQDSGFGNEQDLRKEYTARPEYKRFDDVRASYERVRAGAQRDSGAGDLGLIFGFMKMLDPGSVVREGEFANAENTAGVPDRVRNLYNRIVSGERLQPGQRQEFVSTAGDLYQQEAARIGSVNEHYAAIAKQYGLDPSRIVANPSKYEPLDIGTPAPAPQAPGAQGAPVGPAGAAAPNVRQWPTRPVQRLAPRVPPTENVAPSKVIPWSEWIKR